VGAVDACVFVVAATEGWKPQSEEHLRILELLGVRHGLVALTKVALLGDDELVELARLEVGERLAGSFLADAELHPVDSLSGEGLSGLVGGLERLLAATPQAEDRGRPRLWVDRAFAARGSGTVVTGTLAGGSIAVGDHLVLVPGPHLRRESEQLRVRGLESHGEQLELAGPGRRVACNLSGVAHHEVARGQALVRAGQWSPTRMVDASLSVLASLDHDVARRGAYHLFAGSTRQPVRLRLLGGERIGPGESGLVRLHLARPLPLLPGDRYVLRELGRAETVGGGEVLDVAPVLPASRARPDRSLERVVAERGVVEVDELERLTGVRVDANLGGHWVADADALAALRARLAAAVEGSGEKGLDLALLDARERAALAGVEGVVVRAGRALTASQAASAEPPEQHRLVAALEEQLFRPPDPASLGVDRAELAALTRAGAVLRLQDDIYFAPAAVPAAALQLRRLLEAAPEGVTASAVREALGTSRRYLLPLLAHLDALGATRRRGDLRVAGPRLDQLAAAAEEVPA